MRVAAGASARDAADALHNIRGHNNMGGSPEAEFVVENILVGLHALLLSVAQIIRDCKGKKVQDNVRPMCCSVFWLLGPTH